MIIHLLMGLAFAQNQPDVDIETAEEVTEETSVATMIEAESSSTPAVWVPVRITLRNGVVLQGQIDLQQVIDWSPDNDDILQLLLDSGSNQPIDSAKVVSIQQVTQASVVELEKVSEPAVEKEEVTSTGLPEGQFSYANPAASRYLYAPSSIPLQQGQGYTSQKLLFTSTAYGVTDNVTLLIGSLVPFPFVSVVGAKYATRLNDDWHIGAGGEAFFFPFANSLDGGLPSVPISVGYVSATYGDLDSHVTIATGVIYEQLFSDGNIVHPLMVAGHKRMSNRLALVTENWLLFNPDALAVQQSPFNASITSISFRLIGRRDQSYQILGKMVTDNGYPRYTWDIGMVMVSGVSTATLSDPLTGETYRSLFGEVWNLGPIPWIDYTWHFGPARRPESSDTGE